MFEVRDGLLRSNSIDRRLAPATNGSSSVKCNERC